MMMQAVTAALPGVRWGRLASGEAGRWVVGREPETKAHVLVAYRSGGRGWRIDWAVGGLIVEASGTTLEFAVKALRAKTALFARGVGCALATVSP